MQATQIAKDEGMLDKKDKKANKGKSKEQIKVKVLWFDRKLLLIQHFMKICLKIEVSNEQKILWLEKTKVAKNKTERLSVPCASE